MLLFLVRQIDFEISALSFISKISLAIYGVHALILSIFARFNLPQELSSTYIAIPLRFIVAMALSLLVAATIGKLDKRGLFH